MLNIGHSALFGLGRSTVCKIVLEICHAIATHLLPQYVQIPNGDRLKEIVEGFVLMRVHPIIIIARDTTLSSCKPWLISVACSWMCTLAGQGRSVMPGFLLTHPFTRRG